MSSSFALSPRLEGLREMVHGFARDVVRPESLAWDRAHGIPEPFLRNVAAMAATFGGGVMDPTADVGDAPPKPRDDGKKPKLRETMLGTVVVSEEIAWGDGALPLTVPGPGLGGPPVKASGTPEQRERFLGMFRDPSGPLRWGAYALTEPAAGSDVAGIRTTCRKDGSHWVLSGRKCYITNGARASWVVAFATVDPALGRAGHRAFVVEAGTPGFSVGRIEEKMGLRASETAELVFEECRVPAENLLGGEARYAARADGGGTGGGDAAKAGFLTAMKTFDHTRPIIASMAIGIGRAAFEVAKDVVKRRYVLARPVPRYAAIAERLARVGCELEAARALVRRAAWLADRGIENAKEASMCKAAAGQAAIFACREAIQLAGADGVVASELGDQGLLLEKWFRDIKVYDIFEGTGQIQRIVIAKRLVEGLRGF